MKKQTQKKIRIFHGKTNNSVNQEDYEWKKLRKADKDLGSFFLNDTEFYFPQKLLRSQTAPKVTIYLAQAETFRKKSKRKE